jgi:nicotinamidase-related amidase
LTSHGDSNGQPPLRPAAQGTLSLRARSRVQPFSSDDVWQAVEVDAEFVVAETALLLCDVWDEHWCKGATARVNEMVPRMNELTGSLRDRGVQVIHAPSGTMDGYADTVQRRRMTAAPASAPPVELDLTDPPLPIDDSDGGCDTGDCEMRQAWSSQHPGIDIAELDGISDDGVEVYNLLAQLGIRNLLLMGVHTNMCVLGRSFAIRQMSRWGIRVALIRDLTDSMYNPAMSPYVSHDEGTQLVIEHIEKHWCPTLLSGDLLDA